MIIPVERKSFELTGSHFFQIGDFMKIERLDTPAAGTWARDCELIYIGHHKGFKIDYHRDEDDTYWRMRSEMIAAYKVLGEEFSRVGYLMKLPTEGAFFEILDSPWIHEFEQAQAHTLVGFKHYVLRFYDETVEIIAQEFFFEQLNQKPTIGDEV